MRKIVRDIIILRYGLIGDSLYSFPIFPAIRKQYPTAKITLVIDPVLMGLLENCPFIDEIITFDRYGSECKLAGQWHWVMQQRHRHYDLAIVLNASFQAAFLAFIIGAKQRLGFDNEKRSFLLTHSYTPDPPEPQLIKYRKLLASFDIDPGEYSPEVWPGAKAQSEYQQLAQTLQLHSDGPTVVFHTGASSANKIWEAEKFAATAEALGASGCQLVFIGGLGDWERSEAIISKINSPAHNLAGKIGLGVLAELYRSADLAINNDSGPMHLAAFMGCPVVGFFNTPDFPVCWRPWGPDVEVFYPMVRITANEIIHYAKIKLKLS